MKNLTLNFYSEKQIIPLEKEFSSLKKSISEHYALTLSDVDEIETLVFDEIDTGISGIAGNKVGQKMKQISKKHQIICVTHLATIAAKGDSNYYINKEVVEGKTKTNVSLLIDNKLVEEIARIASGEITNVSLEYAKELLAK